MASKGWQHPYVNIFKHFRVEEWRRSAKEGEITTYKDKTIKCLVFRIRGSVPANSYILVPKRSHQSLGLTGRYFCLLFRPTPGKYFVAHLDVATEDGQVVRISFSNMFKDFKSTTSSLHFPFVCGAAQDPVYETTAKSARNGPAGPAPSTARWTCLMLDLQHILSAYVQRCYNHVRSIKLCSNMSVKNMFTSDLLLDPEVPFSEAKLMGLASSLGTGPMPRDMAFPVPPGHQWHELYDHIRFPYDGAKLPFGSIQVENPRLEPSYFSQEPCRARLSRRPQDPVSLVTANSLPENHPPAVSGVPELGVISSHQRSDRLGNDNNREGQRRAAHSGSERLSSGTPCHVDGDGVHVYVQPEGSPSDRGDGSDEGFRSPAQVSLSDDDQQKKLLPDPILRLSRIIGFGGATAGCALWTQSGDAVVYPCHAIIVSMNINTKKQRFFIGHTDKVCALAFNGNTTVLASAQTGHYCVVRVWNHLKGNCLAMFRVNAYSVSSLSFSFSGDILCGVCKDTHNKTMVVLWNTQNVTKDGEVTCLAKTTTSVDIHAMKVALFDDTRLRNGTLRSCPVNLGEYHSLDFTDVAFEDAPDAQHHERTLFASDRSGHVFEIDCSSVTVRNVRRLMPAPEQHAERREQRTFNTGAGIAINSISVSSSFCATGSEDGFLRLWPLDFSAVILEAEHEGPVSLVSISSDNLRVLAATSSGSLGFLDVSSRAYNTLMRSHTDAVLGFSVDGIRRHLTTASSDGTVRIWNMDSLHQLYDFVSEDSPCSVAFHPAEQVFSCGFSSGVVRVFDISSAKLLAEHSRHKGEVVGLVFSPDGGFMYSADSQGSLALYNSSEKGHHVIRVTCDVVARGTERGPDALAVSSDGCCLAFVGPSEFVVTIADARSLDELLRMDVSALDLQSTCLDSAVKVCFSASAEHLLITTSANKILWICTNTGRLLRQASNVHRRKSSSLAVSEDGRFLLTAGHRAVKVWDYNMQLSVNSQMFIGHSQPINQVSFTPDQLGVVSVGDAIFLWDFLASPRPRAAQPRSLVGPSFISEDKSVHPEAGDGATFSSGMPREKAPLPSSPPPRLDQSHADQNGQGALGSLSFGEDSLSFLPAPVPAPSVPRSAASFLKVTKLPRHTNRKTSHSDDDETKRKQPLCPDCYSHFRPRFKTSTLDQAAVAPQPGDAALNLKAVIGYNGNGRGNMVWSPDQGLFAYSCGCVVVVEHLDLGFQRHLHGHSEEISCLAMSGDAQTVASASSGSDGDKSLICIWDVQNGACRKTISRHRGAVQRLAFSKDDRFLLSVGDFSDPEVTLWSCTSFAMLSSVSVSGPILDAAFSPSAASQLACVGSHGAYFCLIQDHRLDVELKIQRVRAPAEVGDVVLTSLSFHMDSLLFTGTDRGHVCVWDIRTRRCLMTWEADEGEIGVLLCRGNSLLTGSNSHWLRLWDVKAVQSVKAQGDVSRVPNSGPPMVLLQEIMLDGTTVSAAFGTSMDMGIIGTTAGTLWYINWSDNSSIRLVSGHQTKVNDVVFCADGSHFATCSEDGSVRVWSAPSNELTVQFQVLNQACRCVCWSPSPSAEFLSVAAGYSDGTLRVFRLSSSEMEMKLQPHHAAITAVQFSANGHVILSAAKNGLVVVSSLVNGAAMRVFRDHKGAPVTTIQCVNEQCMNFGLEGNEMWLAASSDRRVSVWAADWLKHKCDLLDWLTLPAPVFSEDDSPPPSLAAFCPADHSVLLYTAYGVEKELSFYSLAKKRVIKTIALPHWASCLGLCPKGKLVAVGSKGHVLKIINLTSGKFQDFLQHSDSVQKCLFSPSGSFLFSVAFNEILLWEVQGL